MNAVRKARIEKAIKVWASISARRQEWALMALQEEVKRWSDQLEKTSGLAREWLAKEIDPDHKAYSDVLAMSQWSADYAAEMKACRNALIAVAAGEPVDRLHGTHHTKDVVKMLRAFAGNWGPEDIGEAIDGLDNEQAKRLRRYPIDAGIDDYEDRRASLVTQQRSAKIRVKPIRAACDLLAALYKPIKKATA